MNGTDDVGPVNHFFASASSVPFDCSFAIAVFTSFVFAEPFGRQHAELLVRRELPDDLFAASPTFTSATGVGSSTAVDRLRLQRREQRCSLTRTTSPARPASRAR